MNDDTETLDNFYMDLSNILKDKGENVSNKPSTYTLFEDADSYSID